MGAVADAWRAPAVTGPVGSDAPVPAIPERAPATRGAERPDDRVPSPAPSSPVVRDPDAAAKAAAAALLATRPDVLAARAAVRASRPRLEEELVRLEAAARAAVDVKAKVKRNPAKAAGAAAGIGFLAVGGPGRSSVAPGTRCSASPTRCPRRCCPDEIEKALKALGPDGAKVRGALERDFADYVAQTEPKRKRPRGRPLLFLLLPTVRILILRFGKQFIEEVLSTRGGFEEQLARVRARTPTTGRAAAGPLARRRPRAHPRTGAAPTVCDTRRRASGGMADAPALGAGAA